MAKRRKVVPEGKVQSPSKALVPAEGFEAALGEAEAVVLTGMRPRLFRAMLRQIGGRHLSFIEEVMEGRATQTTHMVVNEGRGQGSSVVEVTRGPTIAERLKALDIVIQGGLKGVAMDAEQSDDKRRGILRIPVPVDVVVSSTRTA